MPLEFSLWWRLLDPAYAVVVGIGAVAVVAAMVYARGTGLSKEQSVVYMKKLGMASEILVSVGILGLVSLAAKAKVDAEIHFASKQEEELRRLVGVEVWEYAKRYCIVDDGAVPPTRVYAARWNACRYWPELMNTPDKDINWWFAHEQFLAMATVPDGKSDASTRYGLIASSIKEFIRAQNVLATSKYKKSYLESKVSWLIILACASLVIIGIAFKWARAGLDLKNSR